jgi:hypothetical protein
MQSEERHIHGEIMAVYQMELMDRERIARDTMAFWLSLSRTCTRAQFCGNHLGLCFA